MSSIQRIVTNESNAFYIKDTITAAADTAAAAAIIIPSSSLCMHII